MPYGEVKSSENGIGTITFHLETGITAEEKLLCTAAAIVFVILLSQTKGLIRCTRQNCCVFSETTDLTR